MDRTLRHLTTRLGELDCHIVDALPEGATPDLVVILSHGLGAPATDLVPMGPELMALQPVLAQRVRFVFPGAPLAYAYGGRAWFPLPDAVMRGEQRDWEAFARDVPPGMPAARRALMSVVDAVSASMKLPYGRIVLGGFSQGGMMSTDVALRLDEPIAGLAILSGTLTSEPEWRKRAEGRKGLPVFQAHGRMDPLLPLPTAERLRDMFVASGLTVDFHAYDMPHAIVSEELEALAAFLAARVKEP
ncbi:phospholipase/carboxylesterase family protein [Myxococcus hansupus]|uniref:Phospholipase/carboxylesterase family protein n=1 Tax=Pseudomyxococcus hansupus TaxID=1297742 RepID=A0A0H4X5J0_9BACT|nr:dienelactone hydrolase family protein [Myxococcus hansupus]AKQ68875.1 phospholipase/carboxylesterase family protein [Myxococcus hansupus]